MQRMRYFGENGEKEREKAANFRTAYLRVSIHRIGFGILYKLNYICEGLSVHAYISLISRLNETFQNLLHPSPSRKRNKTDTLLIVLPRRGERRGEGYVQGGRVMRGRKRGGEEGGW